MKTKEEIKKQIEALKAVRPKVVPSSAFGTDNLAQIDAQIVVLEENLDISEIHDRYDMRRARPYGQPGHRGNSK